MKRLLADIAHARSGDKADRADIGVFAWDDAGYQVLAQALTAQRVAEHFAHLIGSDTSRVRRYALPGLLALKFVVDGALGGGAAHSLRSDNLGKTIAAQLLRMELELPDAEARAALAGAQTALERF
ncbi:AtuA-related protein [Ideonella sp. BN130291]|uniref:AtuA-related protein n=1 Tax=Ideonella sp. BN130291 TaxID=3112940 RepID=UPI002E25576E|nr:hypothetical protein [Ideonella sp. BN130291]